MMRSPFGREPLCVVLAEPSARRLLAALERPANRATGLVELRLDYLDGSGELMAFLRALRAAPKRLRMIATLRRRGAGGRFRGSVESQLAWLRLALEAGCRWVDLEVESVATVARPSLEALLGLDHIILSHHDFRRTPGDLERVVARMERLQPFASKVATLAQTHWDVMRLLRLARRPRRIIVPMGELGAWGRILALRAGSALAYAQPDLGTATAPGQISISELRALYRAHRLHRRTRLYGIIGNPVAHSLSPVMHNAAFRARKLDAIYVPFLVTDLTDFLRSAPSIGLSGFSVTLPHKEAILRHLDGCDPLARRIGAVNTVVIRGKGKLYGYNTDYVGVLRPLARRMDWVDKRVLILGAGGAARAVAFALAWAGSQVFIAARRPARAQALARAAHATALGLDRLHRMEFDAIVNATPVGMDPKPHASPLRASQLRARVVFDMVYRPRETKLLRLARKRGLAVIPGWQMLLEQGAAQFEIWTGLRAPVAVMQRALLNALRRSKDIPSGQRGPERNL